LSGLGGAAEAAGAMAIKPALRIAKATVKTPTNEQVGEILQKNFNKSYQEAAGLLNQAGTEAKKVGIDVLKTGKGTPLNKSFWSELSHNMDTAKSTKDLIKQAKTGNFDALRKLQSDMGKRSNWLKSKDTSADYDMGKNLGELRDSLNGYIENHFEKSGYKNISKMIKEGMNKYREVMQTYKDPLIAKAIGPEEEISEGLLKRTMKTSKTMKDLRKANPELAPLHQTIKDKQALQKLGITGGGGLPSFAALKYLLGGKQQPQNEFEQ
jgi:Arc/MetJ-type ribon-helix-helix transcriptional regulator